MDWNNLLAGFLGSLIGGACSVAAVWVQIRGGRRIQREQDQEAVRSYLLALKAEAGTLWKRYEEGPGQAIVALPLNSPLLIYWPISHDYFTVYANNAFLLGRVKGDELRTLIVKTYTLARGISDSFRMNNELVAKLENAESLFQQTNNAVFQQTANRVRQNLSHYATMLKGRHTELKDHVERLIRTIDQSVSSTE